VLQGWRRWKGGASGGYPRQWQWSHESAQAILAGRGRCLGGEVGGPWLWGLLGTLICWVAKKESDPGVAQIAVRGSGALPRSWLQSSGGGMEASPVGPCVVLDEGSLSRRTNLRFLVQSQPQSRSMTLIPVRAALPVLPLCVSGLAVDG
jgi:hypothetical protein